GSTIFLYTDGIPEATNANNKMFGMERLLMALNKAKDKRPEEVLIQVRKDVDKFVGGAEQFDDLTMLCLKYTGTKE
ncbi:MAG: SpoIIE family protein phosphatase, partial [Erysipelotrichaceae bacterium]|nr:SpoIIE family protein phosphatase [Erysipelotrichaceae bacterium]